jgi:hypothetical protein
MDEAFLTSQEVFDLVHSILVGIDAADEGELPRATWPLEMREWCIFLLDRLEQGGRDAR